MHAPKDSDYIIDLPNVGIFRLAKSTLGDRAAIRSRYLAIVKDSEDRELQAFATILAKHAVLCVDAPKEWHDLDALFMTEWHEQQLVILYSKLNELEQSFRTGAIQGSQAQGQGAVPDVSVVVSDEIQPAA